MLKYIDILCFENKITQIQNLLGNKTCINKSTKQTILNQFNTDKLGYNCS